MTNNLPIIIAEIGINHNGSVDTALKIINEVDLIASRIEYPLDRVFYKFQKRNPEESVPPHMQNTRRVSPVSNREMTYLEYKKEIEFGIDEYAEIDKKVQGRWFASVWDISSIDFLLRYFPYIPYLKVPSAHLTNHKLINACLHTVPSGISFMLSTGMSTEEEIDAAVALVPDDHQFTLLSCVAIYPNWDKTVHLNKLNILKNKYRHRSRISFGYSNHSPSSYPSIYSAFLGAEVIEVHVTLNRALPGSDHAASLEMRAVELILREIKRMPDLFGPDELVIFPDELEKRRSLRE